MGFPSAEVARIASHSMKTTWLTTLGKADVLSRDRQLLGYHLLKSESSVLNYNHDSLAGPVAKFEKVLAKVRSGRFLPDLSRGHRWSKPEQRRAFLR